MNKRFRVKLLMLAASVVLLICAIIKITGVVKHNEYTLSYIGNGIVYENEKVNESDYQLIPKYGSRVYNLSKLPDSWSYKFVSDEYNSSIVRVILNGSIELSTEVDYVTIRDIVWFYGDSKTITKHEFKNLNANSIRGIAYYSNDVAKVVEIESVRVIKKSKNRATLELWDGSHIFKWKAEIV